MKTVNGIAVWDSVEEILLPGHTALIVVDVQNDFVRQNGWMAANGKDISLIEKVVPSIVELVGLARDTGVPVYFIEQTTMPDNGSDTPAWLHFKTRDGRQRTDYALDGSWGQQTIDELGVRPDDPRIRKFRPSAFLGTPLAAILRAKGIRSVLICGTVTQGCVQATTTDASYHDFYTVLAQDCVGSFSEPLHENALTFLRSRYETTDIASLRQMWAANSTATTEGE